MNLLDELMECINGIDETIFNEDYIDQLLDNRDSAEFDSEWCRVEHEISLLKKGQNYTEQMVREQDKIREKVFLIIERKFGSELSDYVADDFGLIYDSIVLNYTDEWLSKVIEAYRNKNIPTGKI